MILSAKFVVVFKAKIKNKIVKLEKNQVKDQNKFDRLKQKDKLTEKEELKWNQKILKKY